MKQLVIILLSIGYSILNCQVDNDHYRSIQSTHIIGLNEITKDSIYAVDISFVNNISDFIYDSSNQVLLSYFALYSYDAGKTKYDYITAYSVRESKVLWSKLIDRTKEKYDFINGKLYVNSPNYSGLLDVLKDTFIWKTKSNIIIHPELLSKNIVLAPRFKNNDGVKVCASLNAITGEVLSDNNNLELKMGIVSNPIVKNDNLIFLNEHLIQINLKTGKYWQSEHQMNQILEKSDKIIGDIGLNLLSAGIGIGFASAIGSSIVSFPILSIGLPGLKTNAPIYVNDSGFIFVVGIDGMRKYDTKGKMLASIGHVSSNNIEKILIANNQMYFSDPGSYFLNNEKIFLFGSAFYLSKLNSNLETINRIHLLDEYDQLYNNLGRFHVKTDFSGDTFFVLFRNGILFLDTNLRIIGNFFMSKKEDPEYRDLLLGNFYEYKDSVWIRHNRHNGYIYLERLDKSIDVVNSQLQFIRSIPKRNSYKIYYQDNLITAIVNTDGKSYLLDRKDRTIIDMLRIEKIQKYDNQYYIANLNGYFIIKSDQLVK